MSASPLPLPWMKLFVGDFLTSTTGFTLEETGAAVLLAMAQWQRGPLPHDPDELARICKVTAAKFAKLWPSLARKFTPRHEGVCDEMLERVRQECLRKQEKHRQAAHETNRKRYGRAPDRLAIPTGDPVLIGSLSETLSDGNSESRIQIHEKIGGEERAHTAGLKERCARSEGNGNSRIDESDPEVQRRRREAAALLEDDSRTEGNA